MNVSEQTAREVIEMASELGKLRAENARLRSKVAALEILGEVRECRSCHKWHVVGYVCDCGRDNSISDAEWEEISKP